MKSRVNLELSTLDERALPSVTTPSEPPPVVPSIVWIDEDTVDIGGVVLDLNGTSDNLNANPQNPPANPAQPALDFPTIKDIPVLKENPDFVQPVNPDPKNKNRALTAVEAQQVGLLHAYKEQLLAHRKNLESQHKTAKAELLTLTDQAKKIQTQISANDDAKQKLKLILQLNGVNDSERPALIQAIDALNQSNILLEKQLAGLMEVIKTKTSALNSIASEISRLDLKISEVQGAINSILENAKQGGTPNEVLMSPHDIENNRLHGKVTEPFLPVNP
jgi:hypothetical protein